MSSILKALKKIENEYPEKSEARFWQQTKPKGMSTHKDVSGGFGFKKNIFLILASVVIAFSIGLALNLKPWRKKTTLVSTIETPPPAVSQVTEKKMSEQGLLRKSPPPTTETKDRKPAEPAKKTLESYDITGSKDLTSAGKAVTKPSPPLSAAKEKTFQPKRIQPEAVREKPAEKPEPKTNAQWSPSIPVRHAGESKLELQAIAWSSDPKSRLAVINGRVVREGESIDRANIMHIGKDEVIFRKGTEEWKQLFGF